MHSVAYDGFTLDTRTISTSFVESLTSQKYFYFLCFRIFLYDVFSLRFCLYSVFKVLTSCNFVSWQVGLRRLELPTSRLSGVRSNRLSYKPIYNANLSVWLTMLFNWWKVETERFELLTPCLQGRCSPNWATPPNWILWESFTPLFFFLIIWQPPTLPYRLQHSTIGRLSLNHRVRDGNGCLP